MRMLELDHPSESDETADAKMTRLRGDCRQAGCPAREVLQHVTGRWGALVLAQLGAVKQARFSELRAIIEGISEKMLSQTLRHLERDGIVERRDYKKIPPHVDYRLTVVGKRVAVHLRELVDLIEIGIENMLDARETYDKQSDANIALHELQSD